MNASPVGRAFLEGKESCVLHPYPDEAGIWTIGWGHRILPGEVFGVITAAEADALFARDLARFEAAVNGAVHVPLAQCQFDACVSLSYNIGAAGFAGSSVAHLLNAGDVAGAADAFLLWDKTTDPKTGHLIDSANLLARRKAERAMFLGA